MPCRHYCEFLILILLSCSIFTRRSDFEKGMACYEQGRFADAARYFEVHSTTAPSDTVLYYLYNCYTRMNDQERAVRVLTRLVDMGAASPDIVQILFTYYRSHGRFKELYTLLTSPNLSDHHRTIGHIPLTRRLYAEILFGAHSASSQASDPVVFALTEDLIPACPDGAFYADDSITYAHLIVLLDRLVEPKYPSALRNMRYLPNTSYLYLPYMRLVDLGVLDFDPELRPGEITPVMFAVACVQRLKRKGIID